MTEVKRDIIRSMLSEHRIKSAQDIQAALKDLPGGIGTVGAMAAARFYLREDTLYFDISKFTDFIQKQINKLSGE